jgi:TatD DNase family protein
VIVHNRNADQRVLEIIRESKCRKGVFHCFSSTWDTARKALDLGFYISFAGNITYKNTDVIRDAAVRVPADRVLIETDAPFLSPQPVRGKMNHPGFLGYTLEALAELRGIEPVKLAQDTADNARKLFGIIPKSVSVRGAAEF